MVSQRLRVFSSVVQGAKHLRGNGRLPSALDWLIIAFLMRYLSRICVDEKAIGYVEKCGFGRMFLH